MVVLTRLCHDIRKAYLGITDYLHVLKNTIFPIYIRIPLQMATLYQCVQLIPQITLGKPAIASNWAFICLVIGITWKP